MAKDFKKEMTALKSNLEKAQWGSGRAVKLYSPKDYQDRMEKVKEVPPSVGLELSEKGMEKYMATVASFNFYTGESSPRLGERRAALKAIQGWCKLYNEYISRVDETTSRDMEWADVQRRKHGIHPDIPELLRNLGPLIKTLDYKAGAGIRLLWSAEDPGGRPTDAALNNFIISLVEIYEEAIGKRATISQREKTFAGPLYNFVLTTLNALDRPYHSENSVGDKIKELLKLMR